MRFIHLYLENWKNFIKADVSLQKRVFIVGPNAAGKSNLLDCIRFLADIAQVGGGFQKAIAKRGGVSKIRCLAARRYSNVKLAVTLGEVGEEASWIYELEFSQDNQRRPILKSEKIVKNGKIILQRPDKNDKDDPERLTQTHLEQVSANKDFREISDFFSTVRYLHIVPQLVREPDRSVGRTDDPFGGDFLEQLARKPLKTQIIRLAKITKALKVAVPQLKELKLERDVKGTPHLEGLYEHWRPNAGWQSENEFSDGTLRLLGLLWAVLDGNGPLLLEEPELSLHSEVVRHIPQMLARLSRSSGRQVFVSSHSSEFLQDRGIGSDEVLLLEPSDSGTRVVLARDDKSIKLLLEAGSSMAAAALPRTAPKNAIQLSFFG